MIPFEIEKGIPIPPTTVRTGSNINFLKSMVPGDSYFFKKEDVKKATRFYRVAKRLGIGIIIRKFIDPKKGEGLRMWRVADGVKTIGEIAPSLADPINKNAPSFAALPVKKKLTKKQQQEAKRERDRRYRERKKADLGKNI
jgi:hypothetical protein